MDPQLPGISKSLDLLRLARGVIGLAILHIPFTRAHLPVRTELDPIGRIHVNHLHLALQSFFFCQRRHYQQAVPQDHAVGPVLLVVVEIDQVFEADIVEVGKQAHLRRLALPCTGAHIFNDRLRRDFLLNIDRHRWYGQVFPILFVFTLPDQLRVKRWITRIEQRLRVALFVCDEVAQFFSGNVRALVAVFQGSDGSG